MTTKKNFGLIKLFINDISLCEEKENQDFNEKNIGCYVKINEKVFDIIVFNKKEPTTCNLIVKRNDLIEILFKNTKKNGFDYGQATIDLALLDNKPFSQW